MSGQILPDVHFESSQISTIRGTIFPMKANGIRLTRLATAEAANLKNSPAY